MNPGYLYCSIKSSGAGPAPPDSPLAASAEPRDPDAVAVEDWQIDAASWLPERWRPVLRRGLRLLRSGRQWLLPGYHRVVRRFHEASLQRIDSRPIPEGRDEIRLFLVVRNEAHLLPWFLDYYTQFGVDRFFCVDNQSSDGSLGILRRHPRVHVFRTARSYKASRYGTYWRNPLVRAYGRRRWCVFVDADEKLVFPGCERLSLRTLCETLREEGALGLEASWIQMYADQPILQVRRAPSADPQLLCPFFDADSADSARPHPLRLGWRFLPDKAPLLFRCPQGPFVAGGNHRLKWRPGAPRRISETRAAVLHFKFTAALQAQCAEELRRREHFASTRKHQGFHRLLAEQPLLNLRHPGSLELQGSAQLVQLGLMRTSAPLATRLGGAAG